MPYRIEQQSELERIGVEVTGLLNEHLLETLAREVIAALRAARFERVLVDLRGAELDLDAVAIYKLAANPTEFGVQQRDRVVFLAPPGAAKTDLEFFATTAANVGRQVFVTTDAAEADRWLADS